MIPSIRNLASKCLAGLGALLGKKDGVNVGQDTSTSNGDSSQKTVQLFIILDGKSDVTRDDTALLVVTGGVSGQLENLGAQVLQDSGEVNGGTGSHTGGVFLLQSERKKKQKVSDET